MAVIIRSDGPPTVFNPKNSPPCKCNYEDLISNGQGSYKCTKCGRIILGY